MPFSLPRIEDRLNVSCWHQVEVRRRFVTLKWGTIFVENVVRLGHTVCYPVRDMVIDRSQQKSLRLTEEGSSRWIQLSFDEVEQKHVWDVYLQKCIDYTVFDFYKDPVKIGEGSNGIVYSLTSLANGDKVAMKVFKKSSAACITELTYGAVLRHPNILSAIDILLDTTFMGVFTPLMNDGDLQGLILRYRTGLPESLARRIFKQILEGVKYLHSRTIIHRDLKPHNIFIHHVQDEYKVKIGDLGTMANLPARGFFSATERRTTPLYMSTEQARGLPYGLKADMFACGHILYNMLTSRYAFYGNDPIDKIRNIDLTTDAYFYTFSENARDLLTQLMNPDPQQRIDAQTALEHPWITENN